MGPQISPDRMDEFVENKFGRFDGFRFAKFVYAHVYVGCVGNKFIEQ